MDLVLGQASAVSAAASAADAAASATAAVAARDSAVLARDQTQGIAAQVDGLPATLLANAAGLVDLDANQYQAWRFTLTVINRPVDRAWQGMLYLVQDSTGGRTVAFPEDWVFNGSPVMPAARRSWMAVQLRAVEGAVFAWVVATGPVVQVFDFTGAALPGGATLTRASTGTYFDAAGVMQSAAVNAPRFTHRWTGAAWEKAGLLVEPQRTNVIHRSNNHTTWGWLENVTATANAALAPNGVNEAVREEGNGAAGGHRHRGAINMTAGQPYTYSIFGQPWGARRVYFELAGGSAGVGPFPPNAWGYLDTAAIQITDEFKHAGVDRAGPAWSRFWGTQVANPTISGNNDTRGPGFASDSGAPVPAGTGVYFWGYQVEQGEYPTSLIPTTGAAATRAADVLKVALVDGTYDFELETPSGVYFASDVVVAGGLGWTFDWSVFAGAEGQWRIKKLRVVSTLIRYDFTGGALPAGVTLTRASTGTYFNAAGLMATAAIDAARFEHRWTGAAWELAGLLVEPQRTNHNPQSIDLSAAAGWGRIGGTAAMITSGRADPTGGNGAFGIDDTDAANAVKITRTVAGMVSGVGQQWTVSLLAQEITDPKPDAIQLAGRWQSTTALWWGRIYRPASGAWRRAYGQAERWQRKALGLWHWLAVSSSNDNAGNTSIYLELTNAGPGSATGSTTLYGVQVEPGPYPTSFIPTSGAAATRAADVLKLPLADGTYNLVVDTPEGSFAAKGVQVSGGLGWTFDWSVFPRATGIRHIKSVRTY